MTSLGFKAIDSVKGTTRALIARAVNSSEVASLGGKKAKTPIIAGSICGGVMLLAWGIGFIIYFRKRSNRKKRNRLIAEGKAVPREKDLDTVKEKIVIPPDPAVLLGKAKPGENVFPERQNSKDSRHHRPRPSHSHRGSYAQTPQTLDEHSPNGLPEPATSQQSRNQIPEYQEDLIVEQRKVPSNV